MRIRFHVAVAASLTATTFCASHATAQAPAIPMMSSSAPCELHIWPAKQSLAIIEYDFWHVGRDTAFVYPGGKQPTPRPLSPARQLELLGAMNLPALFGLPAATVVPHDNPLNRLDASRPVRHSSSSAPCQAELLVGSFIYESKVMTKRSLRLMIAFRQFDGSAAEPSKSFTTYSSAPVLLYPAKRPEELPAAIGDLERAYGDAVRTFAGYAAQSNASPARKR